MDNASHFEWDSSTEVRAKLKANPTAQNEHLGLEN
jgi:hypothetical protein